MFAVTGVVAVLCSALAAGMRFFLLTVISLLVLLLVGSRVPTFSKTLSPLVPYALGGLAILVLISPFFLIGPPEGDGQAAWCQNNLSEIVCALLQYETTHGSLPPLTRAATDGTPTHSWRVLILEYAGRTDLYESYDLTEPWNGPTNGTLAQSMASSGGYQCPADEFLGARLVDTTYLAVDGPGSVWSGA